MIASKLVKQMNSFVATVNDCLNTTPPADSDSDGEEVTGPTDIVHDGESGSGHG